MSEWKEWKLNDVIDTLIDYRGKTPPKTDSGIPLITAKIIKGGRLMPPNEFISSDYYDEYMRRGFPKQGDLVLTTEAPLGEVAQINDKNIALAQRVILLRGKKDICDTTFLKYYFISPEGKNELLSRASGTTVEGIKQSVLRQVSVILPNFSTQRLIASVLSSLDDKIDLLHRQNKTLEAMAETLFRQWFVEPCNDKLPVEWIEGKLSDICSVITKGTTPTTLGNQFIVSGINFIKVESITEEGNFIYDKFAKISNETHDLLKRSIIQSDDVLCSIAGTIGRIAIVDESILPANTNQAIAILRVEKEKYFSEFLYLFMKSKLFQEVMDGKIVHAVQPNLSLGEIGNTDICIPSQKELKDFKVIITPIFSKKKKNQAQIRCLERLRDTLLPKLMSGEVRVAV